MNRFLLFLLLGLSAIVLKGQDDDFFLKGDTKETELKESSQFLINDNSGYIDDVVTRTLVEQNRILDYAPLRELDVIWEKKIWRVIDTREKMNLSFANFEKPFFNILKDLGENGDIRLFRDDKFQEQLGMDELGGLLNRVDTSVVYDPETYEEKIVITNNPIDVHDIKRYRVKEVWFFDKKDSQVKVRILGIAPIKDEFDENTGEYKYSIPLFWVYYPKARYHLGKYRIVNDFNDITPMSWADVLDGRFFASYITQSSNSLGLRLEDMFKNEYDRLLESEMLKKELFNWEHDLWTY